MADTLIREGIAYGSQPLSPVPQYWDGSSYAKVQGVNGAAYASIIGSAGDTARFSGANPGSVKLTATSTVNFSGTGTVQLRGSYAVNSATVCSGTLTWSSGTTATSAQTLTISALGTTTTVSHEIFITNDGPYALTATVYKTISAGSTISTDIGVSFSVPAISITAGVTVGAKSIQVQGLYNVNSGGIIRLTSAAAITATVTNRVLIKELDI